MIGLIHHLAEDFLGLVCEDVQHGRTTSARASIYRKVVALLVSLIGHVKSTLKGPDIRLCPMQFNETATTFLISMELRLYT